MPDKFGIGFRPEYVPMNYEVNPSAISSSSSSSISEDEIVCHNYVTQFDVGCTWQFVNGNGPFPSNMVRAGVDSDGHIIYAGRAFHEGDMIPAKVIPDKNSAFVAYGGEEHPKEDFEVLRSGDFVWEFSSGGVVPEGAVVCGQTADGEPLYLGRALYQGTQTPGKVQCSHGCLYIPFSGEEVSVQEYEVLCLK